MVRMNKSWLTYGIAAAVLTLAPCAFADDPSGSQQNQQSQGSQGSMRGQTQGQAAGTRNAQPQNIDQQKQALKDKVQKELDGAQGQIDTFQTHTMQQSGAAKTRDEALLKQLIARRDALNVDLQAIDGATVRTFAQVRATADRDLNLFKATVRQVTAMEKQRPQGQTNRQPQGSQGNSQGSGGSSDTNK